MLGDTNLNQINELKEEQTNENQERKSKNRGEWKYSWKVSGKSRHLQPHETQNHLRCLHSGLFLTFMGMQMQMDACISCLNTAKLKIS